jgi:hypothetical protein
MASERTLVPAAGRKVEASNPGKVFFSERDETKLDLIHYYLAMDAQVTAALGHLTATSS